MRKSFVLGIVMCVFTLVGAASAQKANYSGNWVLDKDKSELGRRSRVKLMTMKVTQSETELSYERKVEREEGGSGRGGRGRGRGGRGRNAGAVKFNLEGKESEVPGSGRFGKAKLKAKILDDGGLGLTQIRSFEGRNGSVEIKTVETWKLSKDGNTLTISSETETPRGTRSSKMVFSKV